jgi:hypothetical protein
MKQRKIFKIKYSINYPSGKKWIATKEFYALTEYGATDWLKWMYRNKDISVLDIDFVGYVGSPIYEDRATLGDY